MGVTSTKARRTKKNPNLTGPGLDLMDFDTSTLYGDYLTPGTQILRGATAPDIAELRDGLFLPAFDGAATAEQAFFTVHILHDFKVNSNPTFHVHWTHKEASPSGDVKWNIDYSYSHGYSAGTLPAPTTVSVTQTAGAQYTHHITDDDSMATTGTFEPDGQIICRVYRDPADAADTFAADAYLIGIDLHYEIGQYGTYERNRPFTSGGFAS